MEVVGIQVWVRTCVVGLSLRLQPGRIDHFLEAVTVVAFYQLLRVPLARSCVVHFFLGLHYLLLVRRHSG